MVLQLGRVPQARNHDPIISISDKTVRRAYGPSSVILFFRADGYRNDQKYLFRSVNRSRKVSQKLLNWWMNATLTLGDLCAINGVRAAHKKLQQFCVVFVLSRYIAQPTSCLRQHSYLQDPHGASRLRSFSFGVLGEASFHPTAVLTVSHLLTQVGYYGKLNHSIVFDSLQSPPHPISNHNTWK